MTEPSGDDPDAALPVTSAEAAGLFETVFGDHDHVALAVSGGSDSMALLHLVARWHGERGRASPSLSVVTVDHRLRSGSADEAAMVATVAGELGLAHTTLVWDGARPTSGLQAAARQARYGLIARHLADHGWRVLATAHTQDDQAETLLMRLARGSGLDGLAAMRPIAANEGVTLVRPLLGIPKLRLEATLRALGKAWRDDPSNACLDFERVRLRRVMPALGEVGLRARPIATSARRLARASAALEAVTRTTIASAPTDALRLDNLGYAELSWDWLTGHPAEIALRVLARVVGAVAGDVAPATLSGLEAATEARDWRIPAGRTLAGVVFAAGGGDRLVLTRESTRATLPRIALEPGRTILWDARFEVTAAHDVPAGLVVAALGSDGLAEVAPRLAAAMPVAPRRALETLPCVRAAGAIVAVPSLGVLREGPSVDGIAVRVDGIAVRYVSHDVLAGAVRKRG